MANISPKNYSKIADILLDSLPFIKMFRGKTIVIKYGGAAQINPSLKEQFGRDIALLYMLGIKIVIVHGGGKDIDRMLDALNIKSEFIDGYRSTSKEAMKVVDMVLGGDINKELSSFLNFHGAKAVGISGKDASILLAKPKDKEKLHYTGDIVSVNTELLEQLIKNNFVPIVAPLACDISNSDASHPGFNINADLAACEIAKSLMAEKIIFLSDIKGVLDKDGDLISSLNPAMIEDLKKEGVISGGMIPKLEACLGCVENGVKKACIIDGRVEHSLLLELFTSVGIGTEISK